MNLVVWAVCVASGYSMTFKPRGSDVNKRLIHAPSDVRRDVNSLLAGAMTLTLQCCSLWPSEL